MDARGCLEELDISGNEYDGSVHDGPHKSTISHNLVQSIMGLLMIIMSDEEVLSDSRSIERKPPSWQSAELNELL